MKQPDFWDFLLDGGYDLLFGNEEDEEKVFSCPSCHQIITEDEEIGCLDEKGVFKCPFCEQAIDLRNPSGR